jgi:hypothetical protein
LYATFDAPSGEACLVRREVSNSPLQGLSLLNDVVFLEAAQALGKTIAVSEGTNTEKVQMLFRRCLTRPPSPQETEKLLAFYTQQLARLQAQQLNAATIAGDGSGDVHARAAWTLLARALLNLDETITKN